MRYLCMGYHEEQTWAALSVDVRKAMLADNAAYEALLRKNGHIVNMTALQRAQNAATLRFGNGKVSVTDGPFTETKEQLGGVVLIETIDLNHAIQLMSQLPCMRVGGSLEIRPIDADAYRELSTEK